MILPAGNIAAKVVVVTKREIRTHTTMLPEHNVLTTCDVHAAEEAWYWPKHILHSGRLCITSRPIYKRDVIH